MFLSKKKRKTYAQAAAYYDRLARRAASVDAVLAFFSEPLGMCKEKFAWQTHGYNRWQKWTRRVSQFFWTECSCCYFWRAFALGILLGMIWLTAGVLLLSLFI